jgi:hypothetical protein
VAVHRSHARLDRREGVLDRLTPLAHLLRMRVEPALDRLEDVLVRAHRWRRRIETGRAKSITDLPEHEGVTGAYVCRLLP